MRGQQVCHVTIQSPTGERASLMWGWVDSNAWSSAAKGTYTLLSICPASRLQYVLFLLACYSNELLCTWLLHFFVGVCFILGDAGVPPAAFTVWVLNGRGGQAPWSWERRALPLIQYFVNFLSKWNCETFPCSVFPFHTAKSFEDAGSHHSPSLAYPPREMQIPILLSPLLANVSGRQVCFAPLN